MKPSYSDIIVHLESLYDAWETILYPAVRQFHRAELLVLFEDGDSGYSKSQNSISIRIPEGNVEDFSDRLSHISTVPDRRRQTVSEIELLHEMIHEFQFNELASPNPAGEALLAKYGPQYFPGPGHDSLFYSAVAMAALSLGVSADYLVSSL